MRKTILFALLFLMGLQVVFPQERVITGTVTDKTDGNPLVAVSVYVKGTTHGTLTDVDGKFRLIVPEKAQILIFSFIGMKTQEIEIGDKTKIDVVMETDVMKLNEVVVTAIGISREEKSLGYSAEQFTGEELTAAKPISIVNSLQGKVSGVNITNASGAPGASTRVISRGFSTLTGTNGVLYVVDGVPINNSSIGSTSLNGGVDFGNRANDINPDDIASVTFLKGSAGTALYGSRAANGVVVITTKKGKPVRAMYKKGAQISYSLSYELSSLLRQPEYQNSYGEGFFGEPDHLENTSWGPKFDGEDRVWGHVVDNSQKIKPYEALEDNYREFFETGNAITHSLAITNGTEKASYYLSYSNVKHDGIMPSDKDMYNRNTFALRGMTKLSNKFSSSASINYVNKSSSFVLTGQDASVLDNVMQTPRDISLLELEDYDNKFNNLDNYYSLYTINPWYLLEEHGNELNDDRVFGYVGLNYEFLDWVSADLKIGTDVSNAQIKRWRAITEMEGNNASNSNSDPGRVSEQSIYNREINVDLIVNFIRSLTKDIGLKGFVGYNINQRDYKDIFQQVEDLDIPYFYHVSNSSASPTVDEETTKRRLTGLYANFDFSYKSLLYLSFSGRNDWSSTLPEDNRSFFYPAVNLSFVFSELSEDIKKYVPFGKIRFGYAQTGNDANPYLTQSVFVPAGHRDGFRNLNYPLPGGINAFEVSNRIGNPDLQPEITSEMEVGLDLRFFKNRLGIDFSYYDKQITDLIYDVPLAYSTGYTVQTMNLGKITSKGIELMVRGTIYKDENWRWDVSINYTKFIENKLEELAEGIEQVDLGGLNSITYIARPGETVGLIIGAVPETYIDTSGEMGTAGREYIVVDANGLPIASEEREVYGDVQYDYILGGTSNLKYKNISFGFVVDYRHGGIMYSRTADIMHFAGTAPVTLYNDRQPFIVENSVQEVSDGVYEHNTVPVANGNLYTYWGNGGMELDKAFVVDKTFFKLREVTLGYTFKDKMLGKTPFGNAQIYLYGRNLLLWTPEDQRFIDPEVTTFGNDLEADYGEFQAMPTVRSYGFGVKVTF